MKSSFCNPLDLNYRYQHVNEGAPAGFREGADPTLVLFKGKYYLFVSMSAGFWWSEDLINWQFHAAPDLLIYDYAPDVRQIGDFLTFCASRRNTNCPILRTRDPLTEPFEKVSDPFPFWDPNLFQDDDGKVYLYWGCTNTDPIYGVEMDPETMMPIGERQPLIFEDANNLGWERFGENGEAADPNESFLYRHLKAFYDPVTDSLNIPPEMAKAAGYSVEDLIKMFRCVGKPCIEGAFMTKIHGRYYLQYAAPGTEYNTYADGVYVSDKPLGPFRRQASNPFSSVPGGFITGAGHGSTIFDRYGNLWHTATMRISRNHIFERRVGLFPAGIDKDGVLFCNQNFADYPLHIPEGKFDPMEIAPRWMLLSYRKPVTASSGERPEKAVNEDIRDWWSAGSNAPGEWLTVDLEKVSDIRAIQVNLADEAVAVDFPPETYGDERHTRHIDLEPQISHYRIHISSDGETWTLLEAVSRECSNGYYEYPEGIAARYVRLTGGALPYGQPLRVSGLRVFGIGHGKKLERARAKAVRTGPLDGLVTWEHSNGAQGCNVRYGVAPDKLYLSRLVYGEDATRLTLLTSGQKYFIRVDSFNENGITPGELIELEAE